MFDVRNMSISFCRGDTGSITIHTTGYTFGSDDRAVFTIKDANRVTVRKDVLEIDDGDVTITFSNKQTKLLRSGTYVWDVRFVVDPETDDNGNITGGEEVYTPYTNMTLSVSDAVGDV